MSRAKSMLWVCPLIGCFVWSSFAQSNSITTVAGGGIQNNVPGGLADISGTPIIIAAISDAVDDNGNVYIASADLAEIFRLSTTGQLFTVAGNGTQGFSGDGGPATSSQLYLPQGVAIDSLGNMFIADTGNNKIRRVDAVTGVITTVAGNGTAGFSGDGGPALSAELNVPWAIAVDKSGDIFIGDRLNSRIRRVDAATKIITTVVGNGTPGFSGDGGLATSSEILLPSSLAVDGAGNLFFADSGNTRVRRVDATTQIITTLAGNGTDTDTGDGGLAINATVAAYGVSVDGLGDIFITDYQYSRIRRVDATTHIITTVAGNGTEGFRGDGGLATSAELGGPIVAAVDSGGNLFIAETLSHRIRRVDAGTQIITTVAGGGTGGDGGLAPAAVLMFPYNINVDGSGDLFIADSYNNRIRRVDALTQIITTVAGNGTPGFSGDGGLATSAALSSPTDIVSDGDGNIFFTDRTNSRVRRVDSISQTISTVAGDGCPGNLNDGGPATGASLCQPFGIGMDTSGNLYIADTSNNRIRRVDAATQVITTVAGNGSVGFSGDGGSASMASLNEPQSVALDDSGNLFIADTANNRIRRVDAATQIITTVAGNGTAGFSGDDGPAVTAELDNPYHVAVDLANNLLIADLQNGRIRRVDGVTGTILTVAGNGTAGFGGDGGSAIGAQLNFPSGVAVDAAGNLLIADLHNNRIRETKLLPFVALQPSILAFSAQNIGTASAAQAVRLNNTGIVPLAISSIDASEGFQETANCGSSIAANSYCTVEVTFTPAVSGAQTGLITLMDDAFGSPQVVNLTGTGTGSAVSLSTPPTFPPEPIGTTSPGQTVTLTNAGNANLSFTGIVTTGPFAIVPSGTSCSTSSPVAPSATCNIVVTFTPTVGGNASGSLSFTDNAGGRPQSEALSATGQDFSLAVSASSSVSQTISPGGTATYTLAATSIGGFNQAVSLACSGTPSESNCQLSQSSVTPGSSGTNVTVTVTTTAPSFAAPHSRHLPSAPSFWPLPNVLAAICILLGGAALAVTNCRHYNSRRRLASLALAAGFLIMLAVVACGGGGGGGGSNHDPGTPAGTFNLTVTARSGSGSSGISHSVTVTLKVS